ncbi:amino acid ABC transporter ATP-binding protein [Chitinasiproducens palmae]|uniref:Cystine transport system ATP-binding protein n=1 Tax=Chitinasiproducens palmae TaxID=1770053 RepID=A0A1H2PLX1_9BURK|nr:amino acid ABC transporter ATP-binding protein [Chitinasiproducens palmae]SDV47041.1 cystine transport system ATP-binding protein [Chitinasiproducens palmae]
MTPSTNITVSAKSIRKSFGSSVILNGIDLEVHKGEVVVIMGPSGSGKTTLLRSMNFLEMPDGGTIEICGSRVDCAERADRNQRRRIRDMRQKSAMVFQSFNLFPHMTALGNVMEGPISVRGMPRAEAETLGRRLLGRVHLSEKADAYPAKLSGGQKQRVAIARALAMAPEVILFDEPTSALDPALRDDVLETMRELAAEGMTMLIVTHEVRFAQDVADRIVFMQDGVVVVDAPPAQFFGDNPAPQVARFLARL